MKLPVLFRKRKKLEATARRAVPAAARDFEEPSIKLSSAVIVVLILHIVAVSGIYAFSSIKAHRGAASFESAEKKEAILSAAKKTRRIITLEDGAIHGGFGSAVLELLAAHDITDVEVRTLGIPDHFVEHGPIPVLRGLCGMDKAGVLSAAADLLQRPEIAPRTPGEVAVAAGRI